MLECLADIGSRENEFRLSTVSAATRERNYTNQYEQSETSCGASPVPHIIRQGIALRIRSIRRTVANGLGGDGFGRSEDLRNKPPSDHLATEPQPKTRRAGSKSRQRFRAAHSGDRRHFCRATA